MVAVAGVQEEETGYNTLTYVILKFFGLGLVCWCRMKKVIDNWRQDIEEITTVDN